LEILTFLERFSDDALKNHWAFTFDFFQLKMDRPSRRAKTVATNILAVINTNDSDIEVDDSDDEYKEDIVQQAPLL